MHGSQINESLEKQANVETYLHYVSIGYLSHLSDKIIIFLLRLLSDQPIQIKIKAIRSLVSIIIPQDLIGKNSALIDSVVLRLQDNSATVRDVALELLAKCLNSSQLVEARIVEQLFERLNDAAVCVRKRVTRILRDILVQLDGAEPSELIISKLLVSACDDENSVSDLASKVVKDFWFSKAFAENLTRESTLNFVASVVRVIKFLVDRSDALQVFISKLISSKDYNEKMKGLCISIVDVLFESLVSSIESSNQAAVRFVLKAILIFVSNDFSYLEVHLRLLYELTKINDMTIVELAFQLLKEAVLCCNRASVLQITGNRNEIVNLVLKGSENVVRHGIDFLLNSAPKDSSEFPVFLKTLWDRFYSFLEKRKLVQVCDDAAAALICRALFSLGCLAKCWVKLDSNVSKKAIQDVTDTLCFYFNLTCTSKAPIHYYALQSLGFLIDENPELALQPKSMAMIRSSLNSSNTALILGTLRIFIKLIDKSSTMEKLSFETSMMPDDTNISNTIVQAFVPDITSSIFHGNRDCLFCALKLFSVIILKGLSHPNQMMPGIIALSTSSMLDIASKAEGVLQVLCESHASFVFSNYSTILRTTFSLHLKDEIEPKGFRENEEGFESILASYYKSIRLKKTKRNDFISILLQDFEENCSNDTTATYALFCLGNLATLPIKTSEELSWILLKVNDFVMTALSGFESNCKSKCNEKLFHLLNLQRYLQKTYGMTIEYIFI